MMDYGNTQFYVILIDYRFFSQIWNGGARV